MINPPNIHVVTNDAELKAAFNSALDGDRIELAAGGVFTDVSLKKRVFETGLTITSQDANNPAVISTRLHVQGVTNVSISDIAIARDALPAASTAGTLTLKGVSNVSLENIQVTGHIPTAAEGMDPNDLSATRGSIIAGYGYGFGVRILSSDNVTVKGMEIQEVKTALRVENSSQVTLTELDIHDVREGINFFSMSGLTISNSYLHDFKPWWNGDPKTNDHSDMIQFWGSAAGIENIVITGNVFEQLSAWTQTILGGTGGTPETAPTRGMEISNNIIVNGHQNAIYLAGLSDVVIDNNLILPNSHTFSKASNVPKILIYGVENAQITDNVAPGWFNGEVFNTDPEQWDTLGLTVTGNIGLESQAEEGGFWGAVLDAWLAGDNTLTPGSTDITAPVMAILGNDAFLPEPDEHMEAGTVTVADDHGGAWQSVSFASTIENARVVMGPLSSDDAEAAFVRVRNVTDQGFEFKIDNWEYQTGTHGGETVSWVAGTDGSYTLASGVSVTFGREKLTDETPKTVALAEAQSLAVFAQVSTYKGNQGVTVRVSDLDAEGFDLQMQEEEAGDGNHSRESVDWMAIDYGGANGALAAGTVDERGTPVALASDEFVFLAGMQTMKGEDTSVLRYETTPTGVTVTLQEEQSLDNEIKHSNETLAVLALDSGVYDFIA